MRHLLRRIEAFFFSPVSATGFGLMRIAWAFSNLLTFLLQAPDVVRYYSGEGVIPLVLDPYYSRTAYRFSLLLWITDPQAVVLLYCLLLAACAAMLVGLWPRASTVVSVLLVLSFNERNPFVFAGGNTILRLVGFMLIIAPVGVHALSCARLRLQWEHWKKTGALLPPLEMPAWPMRLVLWQLMLVYLMSLWSKLLGHTWYIGTATAIALQHPHFTRFPGPVADAFSLVSPLIGWSWMIYEIAWMSLLIPKKLLRRFRIRQSLIRHCLLAFGLVAHVIMQLLLRVGSFLFAMVTIYAGILQREDFDGTRRWLNRRFRGPVSVLYDGHCGLCRRSIFTLTILDVLRRLRPVDYRNVAERNRVAPDLSLAALDRAMHVRLTNGKTYKGFYAFRALCWHLPPLWLLAPLLYIPGVPLMGNIVYEDIAQRRRTCTHENCAV